MKPFIFFNTLKKKSLNSLLPYEKISNNRQTKSYNIEQKHISKIKKKCSILFTFPRRINNHFYKFISPKNFVKFL